jgi:hypothetical protein
VARARTGRSATMVLILQRRDSPMGSKPPGRDAVCLSAMTNRTFIRDICPIDAGYSLIHALYARRGCFRARGPPILDAMREVKVSLTPWKSPGKPTVGDVRGRRLCARGWMLSHRQLQLRVIPIQAQFISLKET